MSSAHKPRLKKLVARAVLASGVSLALTGLGAGVAYADPILVPTPAPPTPGSTQNILQSTQQMQETQMQFNLQLQSQQPDPNRDFHPRKRP